MDGGEVTKSHRWQGPERWYNTNTTITTITNTDTTTTTTNTNFHTNTTNKPHPRPATRPLDLLSLPSKTRRCLSQPSLS